MTRPLLRFAPLALTLSALSFAHAQTPAELATAAEKGDADAQFQLGRIHLRGQAVPQDYAKARALIEQAAAQGHAEAMGALGFIYSGGLGVAKDDATAVEWLRKGAEKGSAKAQYNLGQMVTQGRGAAKDELAGFEWMQRSAAQGLPEAANAVAEAYYFGGTGVEPDAAKAFPHAVTAAKAGILNAQNLAGVMCRDGRGTKRDTTAAEGWFRQAAERGHAKAQSNLGHALFLKAGRGAEEIEGLKWLLVAARSGEATATKTLSEVRPHLPADDLAAAERQAAEFRVAPRE